MIISASRRTDIPAFYAPWLINRLRDGYACTRNPYNPNQISRVSLAPADVDCIVLWTKNPAPLLPRLNELHGFNYYFQFTLNPYDTVLEPGVPPKPNLIETFKALSESVGPSRVTWRYDPVILTNAMPPSFHAESFNVLAKALKGYTTRCVFSYYDNYQKCSNRMAPVSAVPFTDEAMREIGRAFAQTAGRYGMQLTTCSEAIDLSEFGIGHSKCIDDRLVSEWTGREIVVGKDKNQRAGCGCVTSVDIGAYDTCSHGCVYCYANSNGTAVIKNVREHDPDSPLLWGKVTEKEEISDKILVGAMRP